MKAISLSFEAYVRSQVFEFLPFDRGNSYLLTHLEAMPTPRLLAVFLNWRSRLIARRPRTLELSKEVMVNCLFHEMPTGLVTLLNKIKNGDDLAPHLSDRITHGYLPRDDQRPLRFNPSLDLLLNDWNMHHLHISSEIRADGFCKRTSDLLIAIIEDDAAFIIDMIKHRQWSEERLVEITQANWPNRFFVPLIGILPSDNQMSASDRDQLRRAGCATAVVLNGQTLMPAGGGISLAGSSTRVALTTNSILRQLHRFERDPHLLIKTFVQCPAYASVNWPRKPKFNFKFIVTPVGFASAIFEMKTGSIMTIQ